MTAPFVPPPTRLHVPIRFTRAVLDAHGMLGILFGWALYMLCFSGTLAVLADELARWEQPAAPLVEAASPALIADVAERGYALARAEGPVLSYYVSAPSAAVPRIVAAATAGGRELAWDADEHGTLRLHAKSRWTDFLRDHHYDFSLPKPYGDYLVGMLGVLLLAALVSGVLAHRRILKDAFRLRWGGSRRLANADLHNRIGVWALPFHLVVSLTGAMLGLAGLITGLVATTAYRGDTQKMFSALYGPLPAADSRPAPLPDIRPMLADITARAPGSRATFILFAQPGTGGQIVTIYTAMPGRLARFEGWTYAPGGRLLRKAGYTDGSIGMRINGMITPLHFGTYGGLPLKIAYVLLGASLTMLMSSGLAIWLARRREQGHPAPRRERLWAALVWGQPLAFALSALATLAAGWPPLPLFWSVVAATAVAALFASSQEGVWHRMRLLTGAAGVLLGLVHLLLRGPGAGLAIDCALLLLGGWTLAGLPRPRNTVAGH